MKKLLFAAMIFLSSCTGGNQSITGKVWTDYIPSFMMIIGAVIIGYGVAFYKKGYNDQPKKIAITIGAALALSGFLFYVIS